MTDACRLLTNLSSQEFRAATEAIARGGAIPLPEQDLVAEDLPLDRERGQGHWGMIAILV